MSSQRRAGQGFANAAALLSDGARGGVAIRRRKSEPAARWGYSQGGRLAYGRLALGLPRRTHPALLEPAVQDQRRCHKDGDINRHQANQADECRKRGYRPE
jgi:hypothetical protein